MDAAPSVEVIGKRPTKCHFIHDSSNIARMVFSKVAAV